MSVYTEIKAVMDSYGIPEWLWAPIAAAESGFKPNAAAVNSAESSHGIFQINTKANPQYLGQDLNDVTVNATIAARDFLAPAYEYAKKTTSDQYMQAVIVYSGRTNPLDFEGKRSYVPAGGIRPKWTENLLERFTGLYNANVNGTLQGVTPAVERAEENKTFTGSIGAPRPGTFTGSRTEGGTFGGDPVTSTGLAAGALNWVLVLVLIGVIVGSVFSMLKPNIGRELGAALKEGAKVG